MQRVELCMGRIVEGFVQMSGILDVKKLALVTALAVLSLPAFSQNRYHPLTSTFKYTQESAIIQAFRLLEGTSGEHSLDAILDHSTRVLFRDLRAIDKRLKDFHAVSWTISESSNQYMIFINEKHRTAPPEALAALIAHEAMHSDPHNSLNEEVAGWRREAEVWMEMKRRNPELNKISAGNDPLVDRLNRLEMEYNKGNFDQFVRTQPGYVGLSESSPGFENPVTKVSRLTPMAP
jgi:hypothetical protein